jgi:hypothetical protein
MPVGRVVVHGSGDLAAGLAASLEPRAERVQRVPTADAGAWEQGVRGAVYVPAQAGPGSGDLLAAEPASAYRFGLAALDRLGDAGGGALVFVVRSYASTLATTALEEEGIAGAAIAAVARALSARAVGGPVRVHVLALGLLDGDRGVATALAGPAPVDVWVAARQHRLLAPSEAADALAFLLDDAAAMLNGATLAADLGLSTRL